MLYSANLISVLPLFYVGWSDSVLSPSELGAIRNHIQGMDYLSPKEKETLVAWTNPLNPPTEEVFRSWIQELSALASDLSLENTQKKDLVNLGIELAKKADKSQNSTQWNNPKVYRAVADLGRALRIDDQRSQLGFYAKMFPHNNKELEQDKYFEPSKMQAILDGKYATLKQEVKSLLQDPVFEVPVDLREKDALREKILEQVKYLGQQGYGAYAYGKDYGGEASPGGSAAIFETLAMGNISLLIKFGVQFGLFGGAIYQLGTKRHHDLYLDATGKTELLGCFAMTETGHGSNVNGLETTATYNHDTRSLTVHTPTVRAGKEYIGNALHSSMAAVFCQLIVNGKNHGIHTVLVPMRNAEGELLPGVTVEDIGYKIGLNGVDNGRIWFNQVEVPVANLLDKFGGINANGLYESEIDKPSKRFFSMLGALVGGRVNIALGANVGAKKALAIAIKYALKRRQFPSADESVETLILDYPTHQERLFPLIAKTFAVHTALDCLRNDWHDSFGAEDVREIESLAAGLKSYASWHGFHTIQTARECCGGKGYLSENELGDLKADIDIFTTFEGDNTVLMQLVAKGLLTEFKQDFNESGYRGIARYVLKRVSTRFASNLLNNSNTNAEHILSHEFMLNALQYREDKLMLSLTDRMQEFRKKQLHPNEIFLKCQTHMVSLANAYIERYVYTKFANLVQNTGNSKEKDVLQLLLQTYGIHTILEDKGWFLENDYLNGDKSKAMRKVLVGLYRQLRPMAGNLVDSFGIPLSLLNAKIIQPDYQKV
jgi:acyl-CoA oxidase